MKESYKRTIDPLDFREAREVATFVNETIRKLSPEVVIVTVKTATQHRREREYQRQLEKACRPSLFDDGADAGEPMPLEARDTHAEGPESTP